MSVYTKWSPKAKERFIDLVRSELWDTLSTPNERASQSMVGKRFGVSGSTVQGWLSGSMPEAPTLREIALAVGWSLDDLVIYLQTGARPKNSSVARMVQDLEHLTPSNIYEVAQAALHFLATEKGIA